MKKIIICTLLPVLFYLNTLSAQTPNLDTMVVINRLEKMKKELNLTQEQVASIKPLLMDQYEKNEMFKKNIAVFDNFRKQNIESTDFQISRIMTPEQFNSYIKQRELNEAKKRDLKIRKQMAFYREELKLTDVQYNDLKALVEKNLIIKTELKQKYSNNESLLKTELKKNREEFKSALGKILTKEQLSKFNELHKQQK